MKTAELGYFGNIWVKQNVLELAGETHGGHEHKFDHVTLLVSGKVSVEIEGHEPKEFAAPTFIVIRKEHQHKITAVEDGTVYYCVYALRNLDGEVIEDIYGEQHDPESASARNAGYWENINKIDKQDIKMKYTLKAQIPAEQLDALVADALVKVNAQSAPSAQ